MILIAVSSPALLANLILTYITMFSLSVNALLKYNHLLFCFAFMLMLWVSKHLSVNNLPEVKPSTDRGKSHLG